jgi:hypothetical protein
MATPVLDRAPRRSAQCPSAPHLGRLLEWPFLGAGLAAGWGAATLAVWLVLPAPMLAAWVQEGARVESATVALYGLALLALAGSGRAVGDGRTRAALAVAVGVLMAREMDLHLRWTGHSVLKGSFYLGDAPAWQKIAAASTLLALSVPVAWLVIKHGPAIRRRLKQLQPPAVTVATWVVVLLLSKVLDRSVGLILDAGMAVPATAHQLVQWIEETLELALPLLIALAFVQQRHRLRDRRDRNRPPRGIQERT